MKLLAIVGSITAAVIWVARSIIALDAASEWLKRNTGRLDRD